MSKRLYHGGVVGWMWDVLYVGLSYYSYGVNWQSWSFCSCWNLLGSHAINVEAQQITTGQDKGPTKHNSAHQDN
jgi:hypothetical protein